MYCKKCGNLLNENSRFCTKCGASVEAFESAEANDFEVNTQDQSVYVDNNVVPQAVDNNMAQPTAVNQYQSVYQQEQADAYVINDVPKKKDAKATISFVLGIVSTVLSFFINVAAFPVAVVGFILGLTSKTKGGKKTLGIILNIVAMVLSILILVGICVFAANVSSSSTDTYYGDGYTLYYDSKWSPVTLEGGQEALQYKSQESYFVPIGKSPLSDYEGDFDDATVKSEMYDDFYDYWSEELGDKSLYLYKDSYSFNILKDDIYYATYNYGKAEDDLRGKYYLVVSTYDNAVLSFMTNTDADNVDQMDKQALKLLDSIYIYYIVEYEEPTEYPTEYPTEDPTGKIIYDDELYNMLDSMSNWNRYSELRSGELGKEANIIGGWRILSDSEQYWEFEEDKFWWYQSVNDLEDNYWHGTVQIFTGKKGLALAGLDANKVDTIVGNSDGNVQDTDIHTIVMTPTKIISGGVDKSDTNIPDDTTWTYIWIIVDHGEEGIEAQVLNMQTYDTSYFVKIKD